MSEGWREEFGVDYEGLDFQFMAKYLADFSRIGEATNRNKSPPGRFQCER